MKEKLEKKIHSELLGATAKKTLEIGKKAVGGVQSGVSVVAEKSKKAASDVRTGVSTAIEKQRQENIQRRIKKLNPLFPDKYFSDEFHIPNVIFIVDDAVRRDNVLCEGAIGWLSNDSGIETLYMYDEFVPQSGITFVPTANCDAAYYVDNFDRSRFIKTDCIFTKAHEERLAELKHIAYSLGAKKCTIEIIEGSSDKARSKMKYGDKAKFMGVTASQSLESSSSNSNNVRRSGLIVAEFEGSDDIQIPTLKWFKYDDNILRLIDNRTYAKNTVKYEMVSIAGSSCATMSKSTACSIDCSIREYAGGGTSISLDSQAEREMRSELKYTIEF